MSKKEKKELNNYVKYSNLAFQMAVIIFLGVWGGLKLDDWINTDFPVFTLIFTLLSIGLSMYYALKDFIRK